MNSITGRIRGASAQPTESVTLSDNMSFAAREAYKLLRTNLLFSLPEPVEGKGYVLGITSALQGEGKSTTTVNLARTLAEQGELVLVVECDLRLPSLHKKIPIVPKPGLSNVLLVRGDPARFIQHVQVGHVNNTPIVIDVLAAGDIPPNPSELLGSSRMRLKLEQLAKKYSFILLDLPPVTAVSDALVATKLVDGIIMVVRNEHTDSGSLKEAMRQLKLADARMLGFVYTCAGSASGGYRKKYQRQYYRNYEGTK